MDQKELLKLAQALRSGELRPDEFVEKMKDAPFLDLNNEIKLDRHRSLRKGMAEMIYCPGKSDEQLQQIARSVANDTAPHLFTRISAEQQRLAAPLMPDSVWHSKARILASHPQPQTICSGLTVVAAGSSDVPVAEEAAIVAEYLGCKVTRLYDVGVAGIHRLLGHVELLTSSKTIVAVAGMEGALPGVIAGLVGCPVIAVPTSVGYGANFHGLSALLTMINSCANGVTVVNIDNGVGAGYTAGQIVRQSR